MICLWHYNKRKSLSQLLQLALAAFQKNDVADVVPAYVASATALVPQLQNEINTLLHHATPAA
jgi:hypothetical protein